MAGDDPLALLLAEQLAYYRARAPEYSETAISQLAVGDLAIARDTVVAALDARVHWIEADIFGWEPDERYDVVFFGFWLSHVPLERFDAFWSLVGRCLKPGGRVAFVDDAYRTADEIVNGDASAVIRRRLTHETAFRAVKVPHTPDRLEHRLRTLGWDVSVRYVAQPFFWGTGRPGPHVSQKPD